MLRLTTLFVLALSAQQVPPNTALIVGRVLDQSNDRPVSSAVVELVMEAPVVGGTIPAGAPRRQMTDSLGRFVFRDLPAGTYSLRARTGGNGYSPSGFIVTGMGNPIGAYVPGGFGQRRPGGPLESMSIAEGQNVPDAVVRLWRGGALNGTILDDTGDPIVDAIVGAVQVSTDGRLIDGPTTRTDDLGRYRLSALLPGRYVVFVPQTIAAISAEAADAASQRIADLDAARPPGTPSSVFSELVGLRIGRSLVSTTTTSSSSPVTLAPRRVGDAMFMFQTTFHPQATSLGNATAVELSAAEDKFGVDVSLVPVRAASVSGVVIDQGSPASGMRLRLVQAGTAPEAALFEVATTITDAQGRFTFPAVPVGNYTVATLIPALAPVVHSVDHARGAGPNAWLAEPVSVGPDGVSGLLLSLKAPYTLTAQAEFAGSSPRPVDQAMTRIMIGLRAVRPRGRVDPGNGGAQSTLTADAGLSLSAIIPGRYTLRLLSVPPGTSWKLQSVTVGGREVNDLPFDVNDDIGDVRIVLTDAASSVAGHVTFSDPAGGSPAVVVFPADKQLWPDARGLTRRFRLVRTSAAGDFSVPDLPAGDYLVVAVLDDQAASWPDSSFLNTLAPLADSLRIEPGSRKSVSLTLKTPARRP